MLLSAVLFIPALHGLFLVTDFSGVDLLCIVLLAFAPTLLIQLSRVVRGK